jgi:Amt family ammonium transporter
MVFAFVMSVVILKVLDWTMGLRVTDEAEIRGLDITQHSETAYSL